ncbi:hypothetical protein I79_000708 [Cricetulus griseus]|uniref:Uncharacterized protein n=1 Tax=Cricetulus griseus TaxID=10029 RepID=G3GST7_CRIGR|nr:hypothetical protein I79_000708 [Cricetulus griseus]
MLSKSFVASQLFVVVVVLGNSASPTVLSFHTSCRSVVSRLHKIRKSTTPNSN